MQEYVPFLLFFTILLQIFPVFSPGQDQLLKRAGQINMGSILAPVSALVSVLVSAPYKTFGSQGWTSLFDLVNRVGPKVKYQGQY